RLVVIILDPSIPCLPIFSPSFFLLIRRPPRSTLFLYTTLYRSLGMNHAGEIRTLVRIAEPDVRVWLNVGDAHIGHFASREAKWRSEEHTSELQSRSDLVCRLLLEKKKRNNINNLNRTIFQTSHS